MTTLEGGPSPAVVLAVTLDVTIAPGGNPITSNVVVFPGTAVGEGIIRTAVVSV